MRHVQMLQMLQQQCQKLHADLDSLWISPDSVQLEQEQLGFGMSSTVFRASVRGRPAAVKLYDRIRLAGSTGPGSTGPGSGSRMCQLVQALQRELVIIMRANKEFDHVCRWAG